MAEKVLLVDTNFSSRPIYDALYKRGYEVHVVGRNPTDTLAKVSDYYWQLDYSRVDELDKLVVAEGFDYIVPGCTDLSYLSCAQVSRGRFPGIEPPETDRCINQKDQFRQMAVRLGVRVPKVFSECREEMHYPVIVKPVDSYSGRGITVVDKPGQLREAIGVAKAESVCGKHIIEEYVEGQLYSHSAFIENGRVVQDFFVREDSTTNPFAVDLSMLCTDLNPLFISELRMSIEKIAGKLSLCSGLIHTQFILKGKEVFLIEMTRRCPGDLYSQLIELQTNYPYAESYIRPFLGLEIKKTPIDLKEKKVIRNTVSTEHEKVFEDVCFLQKINLDEIFIFNSLGNSENKFSKRIAVIFVSCEHGDDYENLYCDFLKGKVYRV